MAFYYITVIRGKYTLRQEIGFGWGNWQNVHFCTLSHTLTQHTTVLNQNWRQIHLMFKSNVIRVWPEQLMLFMIISKLLDCNEMLQEHYWSRDLLVFNSLDLMRLLLPKKFIHLYQQALNRSVTAGRAPSAYLVHT